MNQPSAHELNPESVTKQTVGNLDSRVKLIEFKFMVFERMMMRNTYRPEREEMTGSTILRNEEIRNLYC
jgi:hypothetical protein